MGIASTGSFLAELEDRRSRGKASVDYGSTAPLRAKSAAEVIDARKDSPLQSEIGTASAESQPR